MKRAYLPHTYIPPPRVPALILGDFISQSFGGSKTSRLNAKFQLKDNARGIERKHLAAIEKKFVERKTRLSNFKK